MGLIGDIDRGGLLKAISTNSVLTSCSRVLLPAGVVVWLYAMLRSRLALSGFGLVTGLDPTWFLAVFLVVTGLLSAISTRRHSILLTAYVSILVVMCTATGALLEEGPRFPYIYDSFEYGALILHDAGIDYRKVYVSWPGWHLVTAATVGASRIDPHVLLTYLPLGMSLVTLAALMTLLRRFRLPRHQKWLAIALAVTLYIGPVYPLPGAMGQILFIYLGALVLEEYVARKGSLRGRAGIVILLVALIPMHFLTSLVAVVVIAGLSFLTVIAFRRRAGAAAALGAVLVAGYMFYVATEVTVQLLPNQVATMMDIDRLVGSIFGQTAHAIGRGSPEHLQVVRVRILYVVGLALLGGLGAILVLRRRPAGRRWLLPFAWLAGGTASLGAGAYGGEILARGSSLAVPGTLALATWLHRTVAGRLLLAGAITTGALLTPINHFGNELFDFIRPSELAADEALLRLAPSSIDLDRPSRTWYRPIPNDIGAPVVIVYGPLYGVTQSHITIPPPPPILPYWSYDNGDVRIMVRRPVRD